MGFTCEQYGAASPVTVQRFGDKNPDTVFYVIYRKGLGSGFFSNVFHVIGHIALAERLGFVPVVDMRNFQTLYNEEAPIEGAENAWEYYFEQLAPVTLEEVYASRHVVFCSGEFFEEAYNNALAMKITATFLKVKQNILSDVDAFFEKNFLQSRVLGIHFRGQEQKTAPGHPACPTVGQMLERTNSLLHSRKIDKIFLVTEEKSYLDIFIDTFGDMVLYTNAFRTYDINAYTIRPYPRPLHMYSLGREVLVDTLLLARVDYLLASGNDGIANGSNVSLMAQVLNNSAYKSVELIYNGINSASIDSPNLAKRIVRRGKNTLRFFLTGKLPT